MMIDGNDDETIGHYGMIWRIWMISKFRYRVTTRSISSSELPQSALFKRQYKHGLPPFGFRSPKMFYPNVIPRHSLAKPRADSASSDSFPAVQANCLSPGALTCTPSSSCTTIRLTVLLPHTASSCSLKLQFLNRWEIKSQTSQMS